MKLLLDQGLPRSAAALLCDRGIDALHVGDIGAAEWTDSQILDYALGAERVVVTLDSDFHALLALSGAVSPSVIRVRVEGLRAEALTSLLVSVLHRCADAIAAGTAVTVQEHRVRLKLLPLVE